MSVLQPNPKIAYTSNPWILALSPVTQLQVLASIFTELEFHALIIRQAQHAEWCADGFFLITLEVKKGWVQRYSLACLVNEILIALPVSGQIGWVAANTVGIMAHASQLQELLDVLRGYPNNRPLLASAHVMDMYQFPRDWQNYINNYPNFAARYAPEAISSGIAPAPTMSPMPGIGWKRLMDITISGTMLLLLSPLLLLLSAYIALISPGPVFFTQQRFGYAGTLFTMWKFRSMHVNVNTAIHQQHLAELIKSQAGAEQPMKKLDSQNKQIIPLGRLIRKTSLDELPQLFNVFWGNMSLVGPRPPIQYEVEEYLDWHYGRFNAPPGMTGLWQVSGKNYLRFSQMARLDIQYARWCSFWLDLDILLRTPGVVLSLALEKTRNPARQTSSS